MTTLDNNRMALTIGGYDCLQHAQLGRTLYVLTAPLWEMTGKLPACCKSKSTRHPFPSTIMKVRPQQTMVLRIDEHIFFLYFFLSFLAFGDKGWTDVCLLDIWWHPIGLSLSPKVEVAWICHVSFAWHAIRLNALNTIQVQPHHTTMAAPKESG